MLIFKAITRGLDVAAHDVFVAEQVHAGCGEPSPTRRDKVWYWCRGLKNGFFETVEPGSMSVSEINATPHQRNP